MLPKSAILMQAVLLSALIISLTGALGYQPAVEWNLTFGSSYGDGAWSVQQTTDGGYIMAGYTCADGAASDLWLTKIDPAGQVQWKRTFGGTAEDIGYYVRQAADGGYIVTGSTKSYGVGNERLWLLKVSPDGTKEWDKTFGGFVSSSGDGGWSADNTADGGYIITGYTRSFGAGGKDLWLIKTDGLGRRSWDKTFGGSRDDTGFSVQQARDGGYIVVGQTESYSTVGDDLWLVKTDSLGTEEWNRTFSGAQDEVGFQVEKTIDDGYIIVGRTDAGQADVERALLLKVDSFGRKQFERSFGLAGVTVGTSVDQTLDGGYIIAGRTESWDSGRDLWLMRTDSAGKKIWDMVLGGIEEDIATSVEQTRDGGYIVAGIAESYGSGCEDAWLAKIGQDQISALIDSEDEILIPNDQAAEMLISGKSDYARDNSSDMASAEDSSGASSISKAADNAGFADNADTEDRAGTPDKSGTADRSGGKVSASAADKFITTKKPKSNILESNINQVLKKKVMSQPAL